MRRRRSHPTRAFVAVAWGASLASGATDIVLATSRDGGRTFGAPVRVNDKDGDARVNGEQPPRVVVQHADPPVVTVVWTTKGRSGTRLVSRAVRRRRQVVHARDDGSRRRCARQPRLGGCRSQPHCCQCRLARSPRARRAGFTGEVDGGDAPSTRAARSRTASRWRRSRSSISRRSTGRQRRKPSPAASVTAARPRSRPAPTAPSSRPGATSIPATSATLRSRSRATAARTFAPLGPRQRGQVGARRLLPTMGRRWRSTGATGSTSCGRRWSPSSGASDRPSPSSTPRRPTDERSPRASAIPTEGMPHHPQIAIARDGSLALAWDELAGGTRRAAFARDEARRDRPAGRSRGSSATPSRLCIQSSPRPRMGADLSRWTSGRGPESGDPSGTALRAVLVSS